MQCIQDYNFIIKHIPSESNKSDTLSRHLDYDQGTNDNTDVTVLPLHLFVNTMTVTFELNALLDLSGKATTKSLSLL